MILHDINTGYTYDLDLQVYLLNVYHNHEFEIMTTFEFIELNKFFINLN